MELKDLSYLHPLSHEGEELPRQFTFPFRYTPHPLCVRAASIVLDKLKEMGTTEGKMYGVLVGAFNSQLYFLAAYSGQLNGSYDYPWFVPPVVDYLNPDSHFQQEQREIEALTRQLEAMHTDEVHRQQQQRMSLLMAERAAAVEEAKRVYEQQKIRSLNGIHETETGNTIDEAAYIRMRQFQKANIQRAKRLHKEKLDALTAELTAHNTAVRALFSERKQRSEALQQWLFRQFDLLNARGERKNLTEIFDSACNMQRAEGPLHSRVPSGAGECCAPKLLQSAYQLGLQPLAMAEFWWGSSQPGHYREPGAFFPACHSKCRPILSHMLQGLDVEPDPAEHYEQTLQPVRIIWEDDTLAVIYKPEGWCSIPGKSHQANLLDEAYRLWPGISGSVIVHRLDQDTSGLMVIAKNAQIHRALGQQFERREVQKRYVALLEGRPTPYRPTPLPLPVREGSCYHLTAEASAVKEYQNAASQIHSAPLPHREGQGGGSEASGSISLPIGPDLENMPHQRVDYEEGKEAITQYEIKGVEEKDGQLVTRVVFHPQTGRTHQLRVHSASPEGLNAPILGDRLYGHVANRLYLHAEALSFTHPLTHERLYFEQPAPF